MTTLERARPGALQQPARAFVGLLQGLLTWEAALYVALVGVAFGLRLWDVGSRAYHHDESLHAYFSWRLFREFDYQHDPMMHGPFQFHAVAAIFRLFGDSDTTGRLLPVLMGTALVAMPLALRPHIGRTAALLLAVGLTFSPTLLYFSRFVRNDIYATVWTLGIFIAILRYLREGRLRNLVAAGAFLGLGFATKETTFITAAILVLSFNAAAAWELARQSATARRWPQPALFVFYLPVAWLVCLLWPLAGRLRLRLGLRARTRSMDLLLLFGLLAAPQFSAASQVLLAPLGLDLNLTGMTRADFAVTRQVVIAAAVIGLLVSGSLYFGLLWRGSGWLWIALAFYGPYVILYTTLFTNPEGFATGIWGSLDYWLQQQNVERGNQPWFYYLTLLPVYEFLPLAFALPAMVWYALRGDLFRRLVVFWFLAELYGLSVAGEKMPWLSVHLALPALVLMGLAFDDLWRALAPRVEEPWRVAVSLLTLAGAGGTAVAAALYVASPARWPLALLALGAGLAGVALAARDYGRPGLRTGAAALLSGALLLLTVRASLWASFRSSDTPWDLLVYTQSSPDIPHLLDRIDAYAARTGQGKEVPILVDSTDGFSWPWAWYLRDHPGTRYADFGRDTEITPGQVLLVAAPNQRTVQRYLDAYEPGIRYHHRWWFPEDYKSVEPLSGDFLRALFRASTWTTWKDFLLYRVNPSPIGYVDGVAFFPRVEADTGPRAGVDGSIEVSRPGSGPGAVFQPAGLALDGAGNIYVADSGNGRVNVFDGNGNFRQVIAGAGRTTGKLNQPWGLAVASDGTVFVADTWNHRIQKFDAGGKLLGWWGKPVPTERLGDPRPDELYGPRAIAIDGEGNLWVTDTGDNRVVRFDQDGTVLGIYGRLGDGTGEFHEPVGIAVAPAGEIFVADAWNERVQWFDGGTFEPLGSFPVEGWNDRDQSAKPYLAVSDDRVAVTQPGLGRVLVFDRAGSLLATIMVAGPEQEPLSLPLGVAFTADGRLVISDGGSHRLWVVADPSREVP